MPGYVQIQLIGDLNRSCNFLHMSTLKFNFIIQTVLCLILFVTVIFRFWEYHSGFEIINWCFNVF